MRRHAGTALKRAYGYLLSDRELRSAEAVYTPHNETDNAAKVLGTCRSRFVCTLQRVCSLAIELESAD